MMESDFTSPALTSGLTTAEFDDDLLSAGEFSISFVDEAIFSMSIRDTNKCWLPSSLSILSELLIIRSRGLCFAVFERILGSVLCECLVNG